MFKWLRGSAKTMFSEMWSFTREAGAAKFGETILKHTEGMLHENPRADVMEGIRRLEQTPGKADKAEKLFARLDRAARTNEPDFENNVVLALGHLLPRDSDKKVRWPEALEVLEWAADKDDASFTVMVEAMKHDPIAQMMRHIVNKKGVPAFKYLAGFVFETAKTGSEAVKNGFKAAAENWPEFDRRAGEAILEWRARQKWIKRSHHRQNQLENQVRELRERRTREGTAETFEQFRREWFERRER